MALPRTKNLYAYCPVCKLVAGEGRTLADLASFASCAQCGRPNTVCKSNPAVRYKRHQGGLSRRRWMDPETLTQFRWWMAKLARERNSFRSYTDWVCVELLSRLGLRAGELVSGQEHPDRYMRLRDLTLEGKAPEVLIPEAKGGVSRRLDLTTSLRDVLKWYISQYRADAPDDAPLIEGEKTGGRPLLYHTLVMKCQAWARGFGVERLAPTILTPHVFRHSFAVWFLHENPGKFHVLQQMLGHANINTTMIYVHLVDGESRRCAEKMQ